MKGFTFSGGTSTGKVVNDWCEVRAAVPETSRCRCRLGAQSLLPRRVALPDVVQRSGLVRRPEDRRVDQRRLSRPSHPQRDSEQRQHRSAHGSLPANLTFTATDAFGTAIAQQIGRPLTGGPFTNVNLITPGTLYGGATGTLAQPIDRPEREEDHPDGRPAPHGGARHLQRDEQRHDAVLQQRLSCQMSPAGRRRWPT